MKRFVGGAFRRAYRELIGERRKHMPFWVLAGFLPTFAVARFLVNNFPTLFVNIRGVHIHHFAWGVIVLAVVGFISLVSPTYPPRPALAVSYGVGLALAFDEFGMWLRLTSNYNLDQSEDVMVGILAFLVIAVYFMGLFRRALRIMKPRRNAAPKPQK
jgi:hypothetical protein